MTPLDALLTARSQAGIETGTLSGEVRDVVLERILHGELDPGARLRIVPLAEELGVSPTPVREALHQLTRDGFLELEPHRGFSVTPLTLSEVESLYPVLATLEDLALQGVPVPDDERVEELERINAELMAAIQTDPRRAIALNALWHRTLTEPCGNDVLLELIDDLRRRLFRYECVFYRAEPGEVHECARLHEETTAALAAGDVGRARHLLGRHWAGNLIWMVPRVKESTGPRPVGQAVLDDRAGT